LERRAASALDGAVHVALPADAGVLAGEEQAAAGPGEPRPERRIEGRIEEGVAAAREGVLLPDDLARGDELGAVDAEPGERGRGPRFSRWGRAGRRGRRRGRAATGAPRARAAPRCRPTRRRKAAPTRTRGGARRCARTANRIAAACASRGRTAAARWRRAAGR